MAPRILSHSRAGRKRERSPVPARGGSYFAGEVIRILRLHHLDYDQLHRLFEIIRGAPRSASEQNTWRRFTFTDLASLKVAADLIGAGSKKTRSLRLKQLEEVCRHLRHELKLDHPLIHAKLRAVGSTLVVQLEGKHFDATTTQRVFDEVAQDVATYENARGMTIPRREHAKARQVAARPAGPTSGTYEAPALKLGRSR